MVIVNCKKNPVDFSLYKEMFEKHELDGWDGMFEQLYDQFSEFCSHTPAQRYLRLLDRYPRIKEIASYGDIATYLNISRLQLLRIRKSQLRTLSKDEIINLSL